MSQTRQLVDALKKCLKTRSITCRELADRIGVSEAAVKRNVSETSFTLERLEAICRALEMSFYELARMAKMQDPKARRELSVAQQRALAADFLEFADLDRGLPAEQKTAYAVLLAARPWTYWHLVEDSLPARR